MRIGSEKNINKVVKFKRNHKKTEENSKVFTIWRFEFLGVKKWHKAVVLVCTDRMVINYSSKSFILVCQNHPIKTLYLLCAVFWLAVLWSYSLVYYRLELYIWWYQFMFSRCMNIYLSSYVWSVCGILDI